MKALSLAIALSALPAFAQAPLARFDFQNQLSSATSAVTFASDVSLSKQYQFSGPAANRALSLPLTWNSGGDLVFSVFPTYGQTLDFSHLQWLVLPNAPGVADCISGVTLTANGVQIASLASIPQNVTIDFDLTPFASLQNRTQGVTFDFAFTGNPTGMSSLEIDFIQVTGVSCDLELHTISPPSLPTATTNYFQIIGAGFRDALGHSNITQVKFGGIVLAPYEGFHGVGTYEVFTQWKLRVRPPPCLPAGPYTIEVSSACDTRSMQVALTDPATPTIVGDTVHPVYHQQCVTVHAGGPGPQIVFMFISPYDAPSTIPGLLDLQIGDGFSLVDYSWMVGDCGTFCFPILSDKVDSYHYHQGVVWNASNIDFTQHLPTSTVLATYLY